MCNFLSAIVMQNGDIICDPVKTDSHEDLLQANNIRDGIAQQGKFARVEFTPSDYSTIQDISTWTLKVDQEDTPDWFNREAVRASLAMRVESMFVSDKRELLSGKCYILVEGADVAEAKDTRIVLMVGNSQVGEMAGTSKVCEMAGTSKVGKMLGNSKVGWMYEKSEVEWMKDNSKVGWMKGNSKVGKMFGNSKVEWMYEKSEVGWMSDNSRAPRKPRTDRR